MTISEVSKKYGLSADTLRYYERIGLLPNIGRNLGGNRDYTDADCRWVKFIKCMRTAGLSIEILIEYVNLFNKGDETRNAREELLHEQRKLIVEKIDELNQTLQYLDGKIDNYNEVNLAFEKDLQRYEDHD